MDFDQRRVFVRGDEVHLRRKEFELLRLLVENSGRVLTRDVLIDRVWGTDYIGDTKTLDVHIKRLRSRIEADPSTPVLITTVRGVGYRFAGRQRPEPEPGDVLRPSAARSRRGSVTPGSDAGSTCSPRWVRTRWRSGWAACRARTESSSMCDGVTPGGVCRPLHSTTSTSASRASSLSPSHGVVSPE